MTSDLAVARHPHEPWPQLACPECFGDGAEGLTALGGAAGTGTASRVGGGAAEATLGRAEVVGIGLGGADATGGAADAVGVAAVPGAAARP